VTQPAPPAVTIPCNPRGPGTYSYYGELQTKARRFAMPRSVADSCEGNSDALNTGVVTTTA